MDIVLTEEDKKQIKNAADFLIKKLGITNPVIKIRIHQEAVKSFIEGCKS